MAQDRPEYEAVKEFNSWANQLVKKYPEEFYGIDVDKIRCVKITNKERPEKRAKLWELIPVKMPMLMDSPYGYYVVLYSSDWDALPENLRLVLIAEILHGFPKDEAEGKVIPFDTKGYGAMFRTFGSIDYMEDSSVPHLLKEDVKWISSKVTSEISDEESEDEENMDLDSESDQETTVNQ